MTGNEYQQLAMRTCNNPVLDHAIFRLSSEAGEVAGIMQKTFHGHAFDKEHMSKELGDCLRMIEEACSALDLNLEDFMEHNFEKLRKRYSNRFEVDKSLNREKSDI